MSGGGLELIEKGKDKCPGESGGQWCGRAWMMLLRCWIMTFPFSPSIILPLVSWEGSHTPLSLGVAMVRIGSIPELDEILTGSNLLSHARAVSEHAFCTLWGLGGCPSCGCCIYPGSEPSSISLR